MKSQLEKKQADHDQPPQTEIQKSMARLMTSFDAFMSIKRGAPDSFAHKDDYQETLTHHELKNRKKRYYIFNVRTEKIENHHHEFKQWKDVTSEMKLDCVCKYICGFRNIRGGVIFLGITDPGYIQGTVLTQQ